MHDPRHAPAGSPERVPPGAPLKDWQPPWPPIYLGDDQWVIMRDSKREPAALVRALRFGPRNELYYRVVTWAASSAGRRLVGYFPDLETADRAVLFTPKLPGTAMPPPVIEAPVPTGLRSSG